MSAFAALSLVCIASSCRDQDFDWDNVHAINYQQKFTDTFIKEFGQPAEGHQWGFDIPWMDKYITRANTRAEVYKADGQDQSVPGIKTYGIVPNITETEHEEVYEWFSTHRVDWTTKTVNYKQPENGSFAWRMMKDGVFVDQQNSSDVFGDCIVKTYPNSGDIVPDSKIEGDFMIIKKQENPNGEITQRAGNNTRLDGVSIAYAYNGGTPSTSSLYTLSSDKNGDTPIGIKIDFDGAWIQHVAGDLDSNIPDYCKEKTSFGADVFPSSNYNKDGSLKSVGMDQLNFYDPNKNPIHVYDFNGCKGWGWNRQSIIENEDGSWMTNAEFQAEIQKAYNDEYSKTHDYNKAKSAANAKYSELVAKYPANADQTSPKPVWYNNFATSFLKNGVLILGADFNQTTYNSTVSETEYFLQDKWIIVYLKGEGYEGWYLGFDLEGAGKSKDKLVEANGFCNNWIIKLTAVNTAVSTEPVRIMCEDLGGEDNTVELGGGSVMTSDIDYNDIVIDIEKTSADNKVQISLQAAGGTLPLTLWYEKDGGSEVPLFETHELFKENTHTVIAPNISHVVAGPDYRIMYNTGSGDEYEGTSVKQTITLVFDPETAQSVDVGTKTFNIDEALPEDFKDFMDKLKIKVYRHTTVDYIDNPNDNTYAVWQTLENIDGEAPLMICVPRSTKWLKERNSIKLGYGGFPTWVQHPELYFWIPPGVNEQFLYTPSSN